MGKNRKQAKQLVNQAHVDSDVEDVCSGEVPAEFLTSDDFQVVQKKRHNSKRSPDEQLEDRNCLLPRSRSNSDRFATDNEEINVCHSGFWTIRPQNFSSEDVSGAVSATESSKDGAINKSEKHSSGCSSAPEKDNIDFSAFETFKRQTMKKSETPSKGCVNGREKVPDLSSGHGGCKIGHDSGRLEQKSSSKVLTLEDNNCHEHITSISAYGDYLPNFKDSVDLNKKLDDDQTKGYLESGDNGNVSTAKCDISEDTFSFTQEIVELGAENIEIRDSKMHEKPVSVLTDSMMDINCCQSNTKMDGMGTNEVQKGGPSEIHTVKNTAQKKKEKKVCEKQNKVEKFDSGTSRSRTTSRTSDNNLLVSSSSSDFSEVSSSNVNEKEEHGKKKEEIGKKDRKRPSKKQLAAIHEALRKAKEDEERQKQEEETKQRLAEEAERLTQERLRLEQEKKEKKKLKDKLKREKMKAEGKLLSKSQKQSRARMAATLEAFRQQGIDVPQIGEKRPRGPRLGNYKAVHRKRLDSSQSDSGMVKSERYKSESLSSQESSGKESFSDLPSSFESKDSWDVNAVEASAVATRPELVHLGCSEESGDDYVSSVKEAIAVKLKNSLEKEHLAKLNTGDIKTDEKKDSVKLRSPVICVLGHVDTGKTKLLDYVRKTHVQDSEAGGITQQIGATMIPQDALKEKCKMVKDFSSFQIKVPGLLVIDTPGHESFRNLRSRGSSICDIAIVVVDIMHGLEPQTLESINILKTGKIPFVVALNKIDRLYGWQSIKDDDIESVINKQNPSTLMEFKKRCQDVILQFANECLNATLYYENTDPRSYVSMIPTSAITGDGMGNLLSLITQLTQSLMHKKLIFSQELQATVLEVKVIPGLGTTIDVILVNGRLQEGDTIVLAGHEGPIVTQIRSLLMPQPLKEMRVKNPYIEYKSVEGAQGVKITGKDLDKSVAGLPLCVASNQSKIDNLKSELSDLLDQSINYIKTSERGVYVQASTLGSLEALLEYLSSSGIPYFGVKIGPVVKKDVMKASIMLEHDNQYATILAFDVKIERDAQELADSLGVKIFHANIIYHLFDEFCKYREDVLKKRSEVRHLAIFPCILKLLPQRVLNVGEDTILSVAVEAGTLREGTPLCVPTKGNMGIGSVISIEVKNILVPCAKQDDEVRIRVEANHCDLPKVFGTDFDHEDYLVSRITRQSIEVCKEYYKDELDSTDWHLMAELKKMLHVHA